MKKQKQKKQQSRVSDLASHPIRDTAHPIESRPNKNNGDVGEGSPFGDLDVLESQLRERVHVSSGYSHLTTGDDMTMCHHTITEYQIDISASWHG